MYKRQDYIKFISDCKTERECVEESIRLAKAAGYKNLNDCIEAGTPLKAGDKAVSYTHLDVYKRQEWSILPSLIFMGVGAMTDFGPLIANPISFLMGAAAQLGIYLAYFMAILMGFSDKAAAAVSYTHLDVYKRQPVYLLNVKPLPQKALFFLSFTSG